MKYVFGPVASRRLGMSLGLDILPPKTCSMDCVYCECGKTTRKSLKRKPYIPAEEVLSELKGFLSSNMKIDYITFSGSGEPTLNSDIGKMILGIKKMTSIPVCVLTNSMYLHDEQVRHDIKEADLIVPSLDAASERMFRKIDRPPARTKVEEIITSLESFRKIYDGQIWLEILFVDGFNTKEKEVLLLKDAVARIKPDRVQLNTVDRPPLYDWVKPASRETLEHIKLLIGHPATDIVIRETGKSSGTVPGSQVSTDTILGLLHRRQSTLEDIARTLSINLETAKQIMDKMEKDNTVYRLGINGKTFYALTENAETRQTP